MFHCQVFFSFFLDSFCVMTARPFCREVCEGKGKCVVHSCWSVMRNMYSFHVCVNLEVFVSDKFGPHIPAAALSLLHVTLCML